MYFFFLILLDIIIYHSLIHFFWNNVFLKKKKLDFQSYNNYNFENLIIVMLNLSGEKSMNFSICLYNNYLIISMTQPWLIKILHLEPMQCSKLIQNA